jgi:murein L,D-transpeptidase YafK
MRSVVALLIALATGPVSLHAVAQAPITKPLQFSNEVEGALVRALDTLKLGGIPAALREIDAILDKNPNFQLGHLIKPLAFTGTQAQPELVANLRSEARARLTRYFDGPPQGYLPSALLQLPANHKYALAVDSEKSRLYVFRNDDGAPQLVTDFYISSGKQGIEKQREGDKRTPIGVYEVVSAKRKSELTDFYGSGAFPINFPNERDKRLGKTGSGIWIHGSPSTTYSTPPRSSDGCVVLTNEDFESIAKYVDPGSTPIVISSSIAWKTREEWSGARQVFTGAFQQWQRDWESLNVEKYLANYSAEFEADGKGLTEWAAHKRRVGSGKSFVKVEISNLAVTEYPLSAKSSPLMVVTFDQDYKSSNSSSKMKKRQYWQLEQGHWKIVYEAAA